MKSSWSSDLGYLYRHWEISPAMGLEQSGQNNKSKCSPIEQPIAVIS